MGVGWAWTALAMEGEEDQGLEIIALVLQKPSSKVWVMTTAADSEFVWLSWEEMSHFREMVELTQPNGDI